MAGELKPAAVLLLVLYSATTTTVFDAAATWCVVRSEASDESLLSALEYACGGGADCAPIQSSGLCYLPNTVQAHASYAFNSFYQRRANAAAACSFAGLATIAVTDPSYGSCVYPSSPSTAGGMVLTGGTPAGTTTPSSIPTIIEPPPPPPSPPTTGTTTPFNSVGGGLNPGMGPILSYSSTANVSSNVPMKAIFSHVNFLFVFLSIFQIM